MELEPGSPKYEQEAPTFRQARPVGPLGRLLPFGLLLSSLVAVTCFGPQPPPLVNQPMTFARHTSEVFPIVHGVEENPEGDCNVCHGGFESFSEFTCLNCHAHEQTETDAAHKLVPDYIYESTACYACHPQGTAMSRDTHTTSYFPISGGSPHDEAECEDCHQGTTYQDFTCLSCHEHEQGSMDSVHSGVTGYAYDSNACLSCHPDGTGGISRDEHDAFPIDEKSPHADAGCSECHTSGSYSTFSCIDCHEHDRSPTDAEHSRVTGYRYDSDDCLECHPDGEVVITMNEHNGYFPITSGDHSRYSCNECHLDNTDYTSFICIECHTGQHLCAKMDPEHQGEVRNYECKNSKCYSCHPNGREEDDD